MNIYPDTHNRDGKDLRTSEIIWTRPDDADASPLGETVPTPPVGGGGKQQLETLPEGTDADSPETDANEDTGAFLALLREFMELGYTATVKHHTLMFVKVTPPTTRFNHCWSTQMWVKASGEAGMQYVVGFGWDRLESMRRAMNNRYQMAGAQ